MGPGAGPLVATRTEGRQWQISGNLSADTLGCSYAKLSATARK